MGLDPTWLSDTPYNDYRLPGLILFTVLGLGSLGVIMTVIRRLRLAWIAAIGLGGALLGWLLVQIYLLRMINPLQAIYGALGLALIVLAAHDTFRSDQYGG